MFTQTNFFFFLNAWKNIRKERKEESKKKKMPIERKESLKF